MGLPISASYLVLASVAVPALLQLGQPLLGSHLFVLFFACISAITPPVALASYVAAGIADADLGKVGALAFRFGIVSFILPFMFISNPALLLNDVWYKVVLVVVMGFVGVFSLSVANVGFFQVKLKNWERAVLFACGLMMIDVRLIFDAVGIIGALMIIMLNMRRKKAEEATYAISG